MATISSASSQTVGSVMFSISPLSAAGTPIFAKSRNVASPYQNRNKTHNRTASLHVRLTLILFTYTFQETDLYFPYTFRGLHVRWCIGWAAQLPH